MFEDALFDINAGIRMNVELINNISYTDDTVIPATVIEELQPLVARSSANNTV